MKISQYACFVISSSEISAQAIESRIGIPGGELEEAGARSVDPMRPSASSWHLYCRTRGVDLGDQVEALLTQLKPARNAIKELVLQDGAETILQLVRDFDDEDGEEESVSVTSDGLQKLPGQHQLLGWGLSTDTIDFLHDVRAVVDADEYG